MFSDGKGLHAAKGGIAVYFDVLFTERRVKQVTDKLREDVYK